MNASFFSTLTEKKSQNLQNLNPEFLNYFSLKKSAKMKNSSSRYINPKNPNEGSNIKRITQKQNKFQLKNFFNADPSPLKQNFESNPFEKITKEVRSSMYISNHSFYIIFFLFLWKV